jgi:putative iron-only hydrogenase system regulator
VETRIALIGIIVEDIEASGRLNAVLHEYSDYIIGRMGIPYRSKGVHVISVVVDAGNDVISSLSGKLGMVRGITVKTIYAKSRGGPENSGPASDTTA